MARFEMSGLDDVINQMRGMGQESGAVAEEMLTVGAWEVVTGWERTAEEHGLRDTGAMIDSIAPTKVKKGATLKWCDVDLHTHVATAETIARAMTPKTKAPSAARRAISQAARISARQSLSGMRRRLTA